MRISTCEFLRLTTNRNWYYANPGHWVSDRMEYEAKRLDPDNPDELVLFRNKRKVKTLHYFEGLPSNVVRAHNKRK